MSVLDLHQLCTPCQRLRKNEKLLILVTDEVVWCLDISMKLSYAASKMNPKRGAFLGERLFCRKIKAIDWYFSPKNTAWNVCTVFCWLHLTSLQIANCQSLLLFLTSSFLTHVLLANFMKYVHYERYIISRSIKLWRL